MTSKPEVSICIMTYNHEKYIRQALEGILNQKTNFEYEIIVSDDASTDDTVKIIKRDYSTRVILNQQRNNQGICRNLYDLLKLARGRYIACLAGDDFVLSEDYLQVHYDFMEHNNSYVGVSHGMIIVDEDGNSCGEHLSREKVRTLSDFLWKKKPGAPYDVFMKNIFNKKHLEWLYKATRNNDEISFQYWVYLHGNIAIYPECLHAYRTVKKERGSNYNSQYSQVDTFISAYNACKYIDQSVIQRHTFKYLLGGYAADTTRYCLGQTIKRRNNECLKKWISECGWKPFLTGVYVSVLFIMGKGNYPQWYKKIHSIKKKVIFGDYHEKSNNRKV